MTELTEKIFTAFAVFRSNASQHLKGSKAAGVRARKESLTIEKLLKEFRKASIEASK